MADQSPLDSLLAQLSRSADRLVASWARRLRDQGEQTNVEAVPELKTKEGVDESSPRSVGGSTTLLVSDRSQQTGAP